MKRQALRRWSCLQTRQSADSDGWPMEYDTVVMYSSDRNDLVHSAGVGGFRRHREDRAGRCPTSARYHIVSILILMCIIS